MKTTQDTALNDWIALHVKRLNLELCPHPYAFCKSSIKEAADGLFVTYSDYAELQAQLQAANAEIALLKFKLVRQTGTLDEIIAAKPRPDPLGEALNSGDGTYRP